MGRSLLTLLWLLPAVATADPMVVVVSDDVSVRSLSKTELRRIFREGRGAGRSWVPVVPAEGNPVRRAVERASGLTLHAVEAHWVDERIRGRFIRGLSADTNAQIQSAVAAGRETIAILPAGQAGGLRRVAVPGFGGADASRDAEELLPSGRRASLLVRAALYDRARRAEGLVVGVLHAGDVRAARALAKAFHAVDAPTPVRAVPLDARSGRLAADLEAAGVTMAYLAEDLGDSLPAAVEAVRATGVLSAAGLRRVAASSACLGAVNRSGRAHVLVNREACERDGARLSAALLRIAERL